MVASIHSTALAAIFFLSCFAFPSVKATLNYSHVCLLTHNGEMVASQDSCSDYYYCQNGGAILQSCGSGLSFNKDTQTCMSSSMVNCGTAGSNTCSSTNVGQWISVYGSCSGFLYCNGSGAGLRGDCPMGENFDPLTQSCQFASSYPCSYNTNPGTGDTVNSGEDSGINICSVMPNNVFFGSAASCSDYGICKNNVLTTGSCPSGYNFNPTLQKCDYPQNVNCQQVTHDPDLIDSPTIGAACTSGNPAKAAAQCNAYYACNGQNYILNYCQSGYYFDTTTLTCLPRLQAYNSNDCDRCVGTHLSFVNTFSTTGCTGYAYCQNGVEQSEGTCATGFYFDEVAGACVYGTDPSYGCCNPTSSGSSGAPGGGPPTASSSTTTTTTKAPASSSTTTTTTKAPAAAAPASSSTTTTTTKAPAAAAPAPASSSTTTTTTKAPAAAAPAPAPAAAAPAAADDGGK